MDELEKREMWIGEERHILELARTAEQRGREKGEVKGRAEGKAETLLRLLRRRFHTLPSEVEARVLNAGIDRCLPRPYALTRVGRITSGNRVWQAGWSEPYNRPIE